MNEQKKQGKSYQTVYQQFRKEDLILRDYLALDRTVVANERTFLAYIRTALAFFVSGVTFIHFFGEIVFEILGWTFAPLGVITFIIGWRRFWQVKQSLSLGRSASPAEWLDR